MGEQAIVQHIAEDGSRVTLALHGALNIENVSDLHAAFVESFEAFPTVALNASDVKSLDLTVIQIICSACKTAAARNLSFTLEEQLPECLTALGSTVGAQIGAICHQNKNAACAWFGGVE
jgi:anti-anti-sigma regulatory factor